MTVLLRPNRPRRPTPDEPPVQQDLRPPSSRTVSPPISDHRRELTVTIGVLAIGPAWPAHVETGPHRSVTMGQLTPVKNDCTLYFISRNFRKYSNLEKIIEYYVLVRIIQMTYQNVQKNEPYIFMKIHACLINFEPCLK
jgi:hypothetical protein